MIPAAATRESVSVDLPYVFASHRASSRAFFLIVSLHPHLTTVVHDGRSFARDPRVHRVLPFAPPPRRVSSHQTLARGASDTTSPSSESARVASPRRTHVINVRDHGHVPDILVVIHLLAQLIDGKLRAKRDGNRSSVGARDGWIGDHPGGNPNPRVRGRRRAGDARARGRARKFDGNNFETSRAHLDHDDRVTLRSSGSALRGVARRRAAEARRGEDEVRTRGSVFGRMELCVVTHKLCKV